MGHRREDEQHAELYADTFFFLSLFTADYFLSYSDWRREVHLKGCCAFVRRSLTHIREDTRALFKAARTFGLGFES